MKEKCLLNNEDGSVMVVALIMMVLLTLLGISATMTSNIEIQISGNEMIYKQNLYMAEAGAMEAAQNLENSDLENNPPAWLIGNVDEDNDIPDEDFWNANSQQSSDPNLQNNTRILAVSEGIPYRSSLDMSRSRVNSYAVYGRCSRNRGLVLIKVGYRKAF